jgi:hypothetical protein
VAVVENAERLGIASRGAQQLCVASVPHCHVNRRNPAGRYIAHAFGATRSSGSVARLSLKAHCGCGDRSDARVFPRRAQLRRLPAKTSQRNLAGSTDSRRLKMPRRRSPELTRLRPPSSPFKMALLVENGGAVYVGRSQLSKLPRHLAGVACSRAEARKHVRDALLWNSQDHENYSDHFRQARSWGSTLERIALGAWVPLAEPDLLVRLVSDGGVRLSAHICQNRLTIPYAFG